MAGGRGAALVTVGRRFVIWHRQGMLPLGSGITPKQEVRGLPRYFAVTRPPNRVRSHAPPSHLSFPIVGAVAGERKRKSADNVVGKTIEYSAI